MPERLSDKLMEYLMTAQGRRVHLKDIRTYLQIEPGSKDDGNLRTQMSNLKVKRIVSSAGYDDGYYKVVKRVQPVKVFSVERERRLPFNILFPRDFNTGMEFSFAEHIVIREHDVITIGGQSNWGKTTVALNFCGENIEHSPVLMGNEYTQVVGDTEEYEPTQRFIDRMSRMDWVQWVDEDGEDKFILLPVREDYAEHIERDRINIIDWVNLDGDRLYDISKLMDRIKAELGRGIGIVVLQKGEGDKPRGGQFAKDFTDCELLIDKYTEWESLLTIGKVKEYTQPVMGRTFAFGISGGIKIINFREVVSCPECYGKGWKKFGNSSKPCETCNMRGKVDK